MAAAPQMDSDTARLPSTTAMNATTSVLVVDEDALSQRLLKSSLAAAGYNWVGASSGADALKLIATCAPDLVVLSQRLPDMEGNELIRRVRAWSNIPIIVLAADRRDTEEIAMLDGGADDYVGKPFSVGGLMARMRAALRHHAVSRGEATTFESAGLVVDTVARTVTLAGSPLVLTGREFELLLFLVRHAGRVVTHRQVLEAVWGPAYVGHTQYVRVFIGRLRRKIEVEKDNPQIIVTIQGVGYRLASSNTVFTPHLY
ncbi:two-component system, OmpR family, KDP operon response regulator KdpE [Rhizobiales bacterium GAS191]|nr:two component transcriptional regulator, winged helix family [Rhizobiales bacterium GAS113]SEF15730.1 two-component system, OmpR family, KDP operon response regulator KdpE [Rhizobiales bacterium GAS191]